MMVGLGESFDEVVEALGTLREHDVQVLTIGQYLRPTERHLPVVRFWHPDEFKELEQAAYALGFGCAWKTGEAAYDPEIKAAFGLAPTDAIVGFLYLGSNQNPPAPLEPLDLSAHVVEWRDEEST